jgi:hypothetical protein
VWLLRSADPLDPELTTSIFRPAFCRKGPHGAGETAGDDFWALEGFDIKAALARVFSSDEAHFPEKRIELPASFDAGERYDFFLVLAPHETSEMRNRLMQDGIERHFRVSIALESRPV